MKDESFARETRSEFNPRTEPFIRWNGFETFFGWLDLSGLEGFSRKETERYSRQLVMPEVGPQGQRKLKSSSVLVVGAGGLGIPASVYLAAAGVGKIGLVDFDEVETSNLHRQTLYSDADVGRAKVEVAQERLRQVNPGVSIVPYKTKLDSSNAMEIMREYDVIVDCADNFPTRYLISDICVFLHKRDVYASVSRSDGQASVFDGDSGPCYRCLYPEPPPPGSVQDCAEAGVLGVLPGVMGSIQAAQTLNLLLGIGQPLVGRLLLFNAADLTFNELRVKKRDDCPVCGRNPSIKEPIDYEWFCGTNKESETSRDIAPSELKRMMDNGGVLLLDVREPFEYEICRLTGSKLIPLGELPGRIGELDRNGDVVVYCHVGTRSSAAVEFLSSQGFKKVHNLKGGIRAWAEEIDHDIPLY
jgi:molybdopterin/thiamine biosynthesis adenylyltransferase/rhodanese-related sulfurtransferase